LEPASVRPSNTSPRTNERRNVLLTSIGAKVRLVDGFLRAAASRTIRIFGCDLDPGAVTRDLVDGFHTVPRSDLPAYRDAVRAICARDAVGLIIPTRDGEMAVLADMAAELADLGVRVLLPAADTVRACQDKRRFSEIVMQHGFRSVPLIKGLEDFSEADLPLFVRPRVGSGSRSTGPVDSMNEAVSILADAEKLLHPMLNLPEYSIDVLSDLDGMPIQAVARRRRQVVDGESVLTTVEAHPRLEREAMEIARLFELRGHSTLQAFLEVDGTPLFVEANLRIGGASSLSIEAGLCSPERIMDMAFGSDAEAHRAGTVWSIDQGLTFKQSASGDRYYHEDDRDSVQEE